MPDCPGCFVYSSCVNPGTAKSWQMFVCHKMWVAKTQTAPMPCESRTPCVLTLALATVHNQRLPGDWPRLLVPSPLPVVLAQATEAKIHKTSDAKIHKKTHAKIHKSTKILKSTRQQKLRHIHLVIEKLSKGPPRCSLLSWLCFLLHGRHESGYASPLLVPFGFMLLDRAPLSDLDIL